MGDYSITSRLDFETYIAEAFSVTGEHPWDRYPSHQVFQHTGNKKWFALTMVHSVWSLGSTPLGT